MELCCFGGNPFQAGFKGNNRGHRRFVGSPMLCQPGTCSTCGDLAKLNLAGSLRRRVVLAQAPTKMDKTVRKKREETKKH